MSKKNQLSNLVELIKQKNQVEKSMDELCKKIAEEISPYKVGDTAISLSPSVYRGKDCTVESVDLIVEYDPEKTLFGNLTLKVTAVPRKQKDGSPVKAKAVWNQKHDQQIMEALHAFAAK